MYDESIQDTIPKENIQFKKVSFKEIKSNRQAFKKLGEVLIKKNPSLQYRGVYNEDYGVFIDTTNIVKLEKDGKHSFTFRITNQDVLNKIENLVLNSKDDGSYEAFITEYLLSPQEMIVLENKLPLNNKEPKSITKVENLARFDIFGSGAGCVTYHTFTKYVCNDRDGNQIESEGNNDTRCVDTTI